MIRYKRPIHYKRHDRPLGITKPVRYNWYFVISGIRYNRRISIHVKQHFCRDQLLCFVVSGIRYIRLRCKRPRLYMLWERFVGKNECNEGVLFFRLWSICPSCVAKSSALKVSSNIFSQILLHLPWLQATFVELLLCHSIFIDLDLGRGSVTRWVEGKNCLVHFLTVVYWLGRSLVQCI